MKFLIFTLEYPPFFGGVANVYGNLVKYWPEKDSISVLNNNNNELINKNLPFLKWLPSFWRLWSKIKNENVDHVIIGHILPLGTVAYFVTRFTKKPYSVFLHGMDLAYAMKSARKKWLAIKILNNADKIICTNSYVAGTAGQIIKEERKKNIIVVNPGIDPELGKEPDANMVEELKTKFKTDGKIILFSIGRLVRRKGFDKVIESLPQVFEKNPDLVYIIAGGGPDEKYFKETAGKLLEKIRQKIIFLGKISDEEKRAWFSLCDIFIMPSRNEDGDYEGFGIVYLEANLFGKPVIAGDSGGIREAVEHGVNGVLVNPMSVSDIGKTIMELLSDTEIRLKLGKKGRERVLEKFNWQGQINKLFNDLKR